jgi:membrane protease YdiL (CAAX protease family)
MKPEDMGLKAPDLPIAISIGIIIWIVVQLIEGIVGYISNGTIEIDPSWTTQSPALIGLLIAMLLGIALFEETGFRGFLLIQFKIKLEKAKSNKSLRVLLALLASQTFFTLTHIPWKVYSQGEPVSIFSDLIFSVFVNGLIYGLLYLRTRNLFYVMIIHGLGNAPTSLLRSLYNPRF